MNVVLHPILSKMLSYMQVIFLKPLNDKYRSLFRSLRFSSLTIVNEWSLLSIINEGTLSTIVNEGFNETTNFIGNYITLFVLEPATIYIREENEEKNLLCPKKIYFLKFFTPFNKSEYNIIKYF